MTEPVPEAILLLGPTASGKTPLGDLCESRGLRGKRCVHFDFGTRLRLAAEAGPGFSGLDETDLEVVRRSLETGALLENDTFPVAEKILRAFLEEKGIGEAGLLLLNGLPRHAGQAEDMAPLAGIEEVVQLRCTPEAVRARILSNVGGDRVGRRDDSLESVREKLEIFRRRTLPLLEFYRGRDARILTLDVGVETRTGELHSLLEIGLEGTS